MQIELSPTALRSLRQLPEKIASACVEFVYGPLAENPHRVGERLQGQLEGQYSARRCTYRIVYMVYDDRSTVRINRIDHRRDVYR